MWGELLDSNLPDHLIAPELELKIASESPHRIVTVANSFVDFRARPCETGDIRVRQRIQSARPRPSVHPY